ncbi:MAG: hypothetical protein JXB10_15705 [Pirellulales bacterium]|nr:hypothetical protein [Pirellulales bacterium]
MKRVFLLGFIGLGVLAIGRLSAEEGLPDVKATPAPPKVEQKAAPSAPATEAKGSYRKLAPGVMISITPDRDVGETVSRHDLVEILSAKPEYTWAKDVPFHREVWGLEFKFKPVRMIRVDLPQPSGMMQRKLIWYLVYSVTNSGKTMVPVEDLPVSYDNELTTKHNVYEVQEVDKPIRFVPEFLLEGRDSLKDNKGFVKVYPDRVIPLAVSAIQMREDPKRRLLTSVEIAQKIKVGQTLWGVATWEDIDPRIDRFSVYVFGLTNAYRWIDPPGEYKAGDPPGKGRVLLRKTLKLNFWRPSDEYFEHEEEIRYGIPGGVDYQWVYR